MCTPRTLSYEKKKKERKSGFGKHLTYTRNRVLILIANHRPTYRRHHCFIPPYLFSDDKTTTFCPWSAKPASTGCGVSRRSPQLPSFVALFLGSSLSASDEKAHIQKTDSKMSDDIEGSAYSIGHHQPVGRSCARADGASWVAELFRKKAMRQGTVCLRSNDNEWTSCIARVGMEYGFYEDTHYEIRQATKHTNLPPTSSWLCRICRVSGESKPAQNNP